MAQAALLGMAGAPSCGALLQLQSLYPGLGPCYPVLLATVDYFNRQVLGPRVWVRPIPKHKLLQQTRCVSQPGAPFMAKQP